MGMARAVLNAGFSVIDTIKKIWADCGYRGEEFIQWVEKEFNRMIEIVQNNNKTGRGFQVLPR